MTTHLVIPDAHANPATNNARFSWLGDFIMDVRPEVVVCLGDFADMASLCSYDKGTKGFQGRLYSSDIASAVDANKKLWNPQRLFNKRAAANHKARYYPKKIMLLGNHEDRINRMVNSSPEFEGKFSIADLEYEKFGWELTPYRQYREVDGIMYSHTFTSGVMGKPIGGIHMAHQLLQKNHRSSTVGHSHIFDYKVAARGDGSHIHGLSAGCFFEDVPEFACDSAKFWRRGVVLKHNVSDGEYDLQWVSIEELRRRYD